jgi:hypothetical protein
LKIAKLNCFIGDECVMTETEEPVEEKDLHKKVQVLTWQTG